MKRPDLNESLRKQNMPLIVIASGLLCVMNVTIAWHSDPVSPLWQYLFSFFDVVDAVALVIPFLFFLVFGLVLRPFWFSNLRQKLMIQSGLIGFFKTMLHQTLLILGYVFGGGLVSTLIVLTLVKGLRITFWEKQMGIIGRQIPWLSIILALVMLLLMFSAQLAVVFVVMLWCRKPWQLLVVPYLVYEILPFLLFYLKILPERLIPITLMQNLWIGNGGWYALWSAMLLWIGIIVLVLLLFVLSVQIRGQQGVWGR